MTQASDLRGATICIAKAGLAAGSTTTYTTAAATGGSIAGKFATALGAQTNTATPTTDATTGAAFVALAANEGSVFVFSINSAGTIKVHQGSIESCDNSGNFSVAPSFPSINLETYLPFGYVVIKADSTASAWTFGSSNWTATGITDTYTDVTTLPLRPQTS